MTFERTARALTQPAKEAMEDFMRLTAPSMGVSHQGQKSKACRHRLQVSYQVEAMTLFPRAGAGLGRQCLLAAGARRGLSGPSAGGTGDRGLIYPRRVGYNARLD